MIARATRLFVLILVIAGGYALLGAGTALAAPIGMVCTNGPTFALKATAGTIETPDGNSVYMWGYAPASSGKYQDPSPVLCVNQNDNVQVTLTNALSEPISIVFPGQSNVTPAAAPGALAAQVAPGGTITYSFTASQPGTYLYESGTNPAKQVEMGLYGALVVRPMMGANYAYNDASTQFDPSREYLELFHDIDPDFHHAVETGGSPDTNGLHFRYWTVNGRAFPDTIQNNGVPWLPQQPYGALVRVKPYSAANPLPALIRVVNAGFSNHPWHPHGFHLKLIARDGRLLTTAGGGSAATEHFGDVVPAGGAQDNLFWFKDVDQFCSGTACTAAGFGAENPIPVTIPSYQNLTFKDNTTWFSGSPYLGVKGTLPTVVTSYNVCGEFYFPWHSHALNEFVNYDEGFGGLATLLRVDPPPGCTAFPSATKVSTGLAKSGSFTSLTALESPTPQYYQVSSPMTTLRAAMTNVQLTAPISSTSGFPTAAPFYIRVDNEVMQVTGGQTTTTWTVSRAQLGTLAAAHANGARVSLVPAVADWYGSLSGVATGALNLKVTYQGKNCALTSTPTSCAAEVAIPTTLSIWNWRTNAWVQIASQPVSSTETAFTDVAVPASPSAGKWSDYIGGGAYAGQARIRVLSQRASATAGPAFQSWGNFMKLVYDAP